MNEGKLLSGNKSCNIISADNKVIDTVSRGYLSETKKPKAIIPIIITLSVLIPIAVALLMLFPDVFAIESNTIDFGSLPFFHAVLNGSAAILIFTGYVLIKNKKAQLHKAAMLSAFVLSAVFLISYVVSKLTNPPVPLVEKVLFVLYTFLF